MGGMVLGDLTFFDLRPMGPPHFPPTKKFTNQKFSKPKYLTSLYLMCYNVNNREDVPGGDTIEEKIFTRL